jgi:hypothetical protein
MTEPYTPERPMYPDVRVTLPAIADPVEIVAAVSDALRRKAGHNAANWFENTAIEIPVGELVGFVRSTVTVCVS